MARKKKHPEHVNHERWLVSYADFITLLFAFFVVMFASSQGDKGKAAQVSESVRKALEEGSVAAVVASVLGGTPGEKGQGNAMMRGPGGTMPQAKASPNPGSVVELKPSMELLVLDLKAEILAGKMKVELQKRGLVISLQQAAFFPSGGDAVEPEMQPSIGKVALAVAKLPNPVRLEGHTDSVPIHNLRFRSNWELSAARSIATLELLAGRFAIPRVRMAVSGYAETVPVESNETEAGRARNRRVDIVILNELGVVSEPGAVAKPEPAGKPAPKKSAH
jgi:chemotaxis protein MotB